MTLGRNTFDLAKVIDTMPICGECFENGYKITFQPCPSHN